MRPGTNLDNLSPYPGEKKFSRYVQNRKFGDGVLPSGVIFDVPNCLVPREVLPAPPPNAFGMSGAGSCC